jgi:ribosomal protein S27E
MTREKRTLISLENSEKSKGDFLRFPCRLDEFANSLLLFDKLCVLTTNYLELGNIIPWMGEENFCSMIDSGKLEFALVPYDVSFTKTRNLITFYVFQSQLNIPNLDLSKPLDRARLLKSTMEQYPYFHENVTLSDSVLRSVALHTITSDDYFFVKFPKNLKFTIREIIENIPGHKMSTLLGHEFELRECTRFREDGKLEVTDPDCEYAVKYLKEDLLKLLKAVKELFISGYFYMDIINASSFINLFFEYLMFKYVVHARNEAFIESLDFRQMNLVGKGVYDGSVTGLDVLFIRETSQGKKFRKWVTSLETLPLKGAELIAEYSHVVAIEIPRESVVKSNLKVLANKGVFPVTRDKFLQQSFNKENLIFTEWYFRDKWNPHLFIRGDFEESLTQSTHRGPEIPVDLLALIYRGCEVEYFKMKADYSYSVKLKTFNGGKVYNLDLPNTPDNMMYLAKNLASIRKSSGSEDFYYICPECDLENTIFSTIMPVTDIKCINCNKSPFEGALS